MDFPGVAHSRKDKAVPFQSCLFFLMYSPCPAVEVSRRSLFIRGALRGLRAAAVLRVQLGVSGKEQDPGEGRNGDQAGGAGILEEAESWLVLQDGPARVPPRRTRPQQEG